MKTSAVLFLASIIGLTLANPIDQECPATLSKAGFNMTFLREGAAHGIHSISVQDIRYYFDADFPVQNNVPTVNLQLDSPDLILSSAPFGSDFKTPGMRVLDTILSNDDGESDNFAIQGLSVMEKIAHGMHMLEVWQKTSQFYQDFKANPVSHEVCACAIDDEQTGMLDKLKYIAGLLRTFSQQHEMRCTCFGYTCFGYNPFCYKKSGDVVKPESLVEMPKLPDLENSASWGPWKTMLEGSMPTDEELRHFAMYMFCKINV